MSNDQASTSASASGLPSPNAATAQPQAQQDQAKGKGKEGKSAKDLKKEKRAAAVAVRGDAPPKRAAEAAASSSAHLNKPLNAAPAAAPTTPVLSPVQNLFAHLPTHKPVSTPSALLSSKLHPVIIRLGVLMSNGVLRGANARTLGLMAAFKEVIREYEAPEGTLLWKDLPVHLSPMIAWLDGCRPKGVGGGNAIRWLKSEINRIGEEGGRTEAEQKQILTDAIDDYLRDRIELAGEVIAAIAREKIHPGDVVVTYARSSLVEKVLVDAWENMRQEGDGKFTVIVVDSRPLLEGRTLLEALTAHGIPCQYALLTTLPSVLPRASLVLLGASALHSDGALSGRAGTAIVAMQAKELRVPVVACCETYKFGERVVLDAIAGNELGETAPLLSLPHSNHLQVKPVPSLTPLHLLYDLTPPSLITAVCTEVGFIPPSSVPTVIGNKASGNF